MKVFLLVLVIHTVRLSHDLATSNKAMTVVILAYITYKLITSGSLSFISSYVFCLSLNETLYIQLCGG